MPRSQGLQAALAQSTPVLLMGQMSAVWEHHGRMRTSGRTCAACAYARPWRLPRGVHYKPPAPRTTTPPADVRCGLSQTFPAGRVGPADPKAGRPHT